MVLEMFETTELVCLMFYISFFTITFPDSFVWVFTGCWSSRRMMSLYASVTLILKYIFSFLFTHYLFCYMLYRIAYVIILFNIKYVVNIQNS